MKKIILLSCVLCVVQLCIGQEETITLFESTFKLRSKNVENYFFGFAQGDELVVSLEEIKGKKLNGVSIKEYPDRLLFSEYKTSKIEQKKMKIQTTGIYQFQFENGVGGKVCKLIIQRIPASSETRNFNSTVYWHDSNDTLYKERNETYLAKSDTSIFDVINTTTKVHSSSNLNGNTSTANFSLPANTVLWSYYVGVDQSGQDAYERATAQLTKSAGPLIAKIPGYGPTAALALGLTSYLSFAQKGEDVDYYLVEGANVNLYNSGQSFSYLKKGNVINDFSRMESASKGNYQFCFKNDNAVVGISVLLKVTVVVLNQEWGMRKVQHIQIVAKNQPYLKNE